MKQNIDYKVGLVFYLMMLVSASVYAQNLIQNSSFETGNAPWLSKGDTMERHHESILKVKPVDGVYYAELANNKGYKLFQTVAVKTGAYYQVSFFAQARPGVSERESHFTFTVNDDELTAKIQPTLGDWQQYVYTIKAISSELTLSFEDTYYGAEGIGAMVDVVEVKELEQDNFISIFDGSSLEGWKVYGRLADIEKNYLNV